MYKSIIRPLLFLADPEKVHYFTFSALKYFLRFSPIRRWVEKTYSIRRPELEREVFGIKFPNPVGLAAGFDKDAKLFDELSAFGFGFIEIGTLTPLPQPGNPKKRLFRLRKDSALINLMGFNIGGVAAAAQRLRQNRNVLIGGNIGKNKDTANEDAASDYIKCFEALYDVVDYFVVNVSSPNTPNLRDLQEKEPLTGLLSELQHLNATKPHHKPILLKIAPDLTQGQLRDIIDIVAQTRIAGVIATNTTLSREGLTDENKKEAGGMSGKPLCDRSTQVIRFLYEQSGGAFPIIGVGGIHSADDAIEKLEAGASLVQLYTGFIYEGPALVKQINQRILQRMR